MRSSQENNHHIGVERGFFHLPLGKETATYEQLN